MLGSKDTMEPCVKCWRINMSKARHRIVHGEDGGKYTDDNICYLCEVCHTEWHSFNLQYTLSFEQWLVLPSGHDLAMLYVAGIKSADHLIITYGVQETYEAIGKLFAAAPDEIFRATPKHSNYPRDRRLFWAWCSMFASEKFPPDAEEKDALAVA